MSVVNVVEFLSENFSNMSLGPLLKKACINLKLPVSGTNSKKTERLQEYFDSNTDITITKKLFMPDKKKPIATNTKKKYRLGELFAGTGGFSFAFKETNCVSTVFANDKEKQCKPLFDANFSDVKLTVKDINDYDISKIPNIDILTFGSPCQSFSIAGERKGFEDPRGNVFWRIVEILKKKKGTNK